MSAYSTLDTGQPALAARASSWNCSRGDSRHLAAEFQAHGGDRPVHALAFHRQDGLRAQLVGRKAGAAELKAERHVEAGRVRRGDQFFRVGARPAVLALEPRGGGIRLVPQRAAERAQPSGALGPGAVPYRTASALEHLAVPVVMG